MPTSKDLEKLIKKIKTESDVDRAKALSNILRGHLDRLDNQIRDKEELLTN